MKSENEIKNEIIEVGKRLHARGWISATDGNISIKLDSNRVMTTPTGVHKGYLTHDDFVIVDMDGNQLSGKAKPSSELAMHLTCYREREDICSVIHAHPTYCIVMSVAGITLAKCLLPEVIFTLGSIPTAEYAPPTTRQVAESIVEPVKDHDAIILERHGSLTVGKNLFDAYNKLERMEHVAEITFKTRQLGGDKPLTPVQVNELYDIKSSLGLDKKREAVNCNSCNACGKYSSCSSAKGRPSGSAEPAKKDGMSLFFPDINKAAKSKAEEALVGATESSHDCYRDEGEQSSVSSTVIPNISPEVMNIIVEEITAELKSVY